MKKTESEVIVIGAGLTGLTLAYLLSQNGIKSIIVEARDRVGGRILTNRKEDGPPVELGATWLGKQHTHLIDLLGDLNIEVFEQKLDQKAIYEPFSTSPPQLVKLPTSESPNYRIKDGTDQILKKMFSHIDSTSIHTGQVVSFIEKREDQVSVITDNHHFEGKIVVSTLPPQLFVKSIQANPSLPSNLIKIAHKTHTWMGESIKVALTYKDCFWDIETLSGTIFSNVGPITEMYDHSNYEENRFALKGFMSGNYFGIKKMERLQLILRQLEKYYGNKVLGYVSYEEKVWKHEKFTSITSDDYILPHQNNGHDVYQKSYWDGSLYVSGTETSPRNGGYMEGAVFSAKTTFEKILTSIKSTYLSKL